MTVPDNEFYQAFGRLEQQVKDLCEKVERSLHQKDDMDKRVRALENWRWMVMGGAVVLSTIASVVAEHLIK
jgi:predicted site-specific integrase-resolvase